VDVLANSGDYSSWSQHCLYSYHKGSVEDIVFSPNEPTVFASCTHPFSLGSSDGTLQIVDTRVGTPKKSQLLIAAHDTDVNVCDWSAASPNLIVTGSDDCSVKVWDLRKQKQQKSKSS
jgi:ribosome assembly protein RRB1